MIPGLGRSPGEEKGYPLQYSGLENPYMGSRLSDFHFHINLSNQHIVYPTLMHCYMPIMGFPGSSAGEESTCNAGDPGLIPGSGRSTGEGIAYPLQYSWVSLVAQLVKNPPVMWETWVRSLG